MAFIYPPPNFYVGPDTSSPPIDIVGVKPPIRYVNGIVSVHNSLSGQVTEISADPTLSANADTIIPTQKATKEYVDTQAMVLPTVMQLPNGFPNLTDSTVTWDDASLTLTIAPTAPGGSFDYYIKGVKYTKNAAVTRTITNSSGLHYISFDGPNLVGYTVWGDWLVTEQALVAIIYWNAAVGAAIIVGEERHGTTMSPSTHLSLHYGLGTTYSSAMTPADFTIGDGSLDSHAQFSITTGYMRDEDIARTIQAKLQAGVIKMLYMLGAGVWYEMGTTGAYASNGTNLLYNLNTAGVWSAENVADNKYVIGHIMASNNSRYCAIMGQNTYNSIIAARNAAATELETMTLTGLPAADMLAVMSVIYQSSSTYGNTIKGRVVEISTGVDYIDWRKQKLTSASGSTNNHTALANLSNDDHLQYVAVAGRVGDVITVPNTTAADISTGAGAVKVAGGIYATKSIVASQGLVCAAVPPASQLVMYSDPVNAIGGAINVAANGNMELRCTSGRTFITSDGVEQLSLLDLQSGKVTKFYSDGTGNLTLTPDGSTYLTKPTRQTTTSGGGFQLYYDGTHYTDLYTTSSGNLEIAASGTNINMAVGNRVVVNNASEATNSASGAIVTNGGISAVKNIFTDGDVSCYNSVVRSAVNATNTTSGALQVAGGAGIVSDLWVGGTIHSAGNAVPTYISTTGTMSLGGIWSANIDNVTWSIRKLGDEVSFTVTTAAKSSYTSGTSLNTTTAIVPAAYRPSAAQFAVSQYTLNNLNQYSTIARINTDGTINWLNPGGATMTGYCGLYPCTIHWLVY